MTKNDTLREQLEDIVTRKGTSARIPEILELELDDLENFIEEHTARAVEEALGSANLPKFHLKKDQYGTFCGYGMWYAAQIVEIVEDATCKTCIRLATPTPKPEENV